MEAQMCICVWNVLIPTTFNLKIKQSKLFSNIKSWVFLHAMHKFQLSNYEFVVLEVLHILENV